VHGDDVMPMHWTTTVVLRCPRETRASKDARPTQVGYCGLASPNIRMSGKPDIRAVALQGSPGSRPGSRLMVTEIVSQRLSLAMSVIFSIAAGMASPALAQDTIAIGFTASKTGALSEDSLAQVRGFELWRDEVNAAGGLKAGSKKYKIAFKSHDDQSQVVRVQELYGRLITQDKAQLLFGPVSSGLNAMAAFVSEENGKVMLSTAVDPKIFRLGNRNLFQVTTPSSRSFAGAIAALKARNPKARVALVYKDDPFTRAVMQATRELAAAEGLTVVLDEAYSPTASDFGPLVGKVIAAKADGLLGGGHASDGMALARTLHDRKAGLKWVTLLVAPGLPQFADLGDAALGVSSPSQWVPQVTYKPQFGPSSPVFGNRFGDKFKTAATEVAAAGYASGLILGHAIEAAGSLDAGKIVNALNKIDANTMFGRARFAVDPKEHGLQLAHDMILQQWQRKNGRLIPEVIAPLSAKTADPL
jgi:branched-chain amino acid transport system substrate-binding protein